MAAIITDDFRRNQARLLIDEVISSSQNVAIGIGKSDQWADDSSGYSESDTGFTVTVPSGTVQEQQDVLNNLITLKEVTGAERLVPKNTWATGNTYKVYDHTDTACFYDDNDGKSCCVVDNNNIYLCISNVAGTSDTPGVSGSGQSPNTIVDTDYGIKAGTDGYVWAHVSKIPTSGTAFKFVIPQFVPVLKDSDVTSLFGEIDGTAEDLTAGLLSHIGVSNGGTGYTSAPTATLTLVDSDGAEISHGLQLKVVLDGTSVGSILIQESGETGDGSTTYWNSSPSLIELGATIGSVSFSGGGGSGAEAYPVIAGPRGYAKDAIDVLPTWFVGATADFDDEEGGDAPNPIDFRQVSLVANYQRSVNDDSTTDTLSCLKGLTLTNETADLGNLQSGDILSCGDSLLYFDYYDDSGSNTILYYHQNSNSDVNFIKAPALGDQLDYVSGPSGLTGTPKIADSAIPLGNTAGPEYSALGSAKGQVIFHENRAPFSREDGQTEEIKLIIQL